MPRRRLQDRIEDLVTKAIATDDPHELDAFKKRWGQTWAQDPYYNPNLSVYEDDYRIEIGSG